MTQLAPKVNRTFAKINTSYLALGSVFATREGYESTYASNRVKH